MMDRSWVERDISDYITCDEYDSNKRRTLNGLELSSAFKKVYKLIQNTIK